MIGDSEMNILLTAFINTSSELLIKSFCDNYDKLILENNKKQCFSQFKDKIEAKNYDYVFSFGQKPVISDKVYIEQYAKNDKGTYETTIDITKFANAFMSSALTVKLSKNAGTSYCNYLYAQGLEYLILSNLTTKMIFIHVPFSKNITDFNNFSQKIKDAIGNYARGYYD